MKVQDERIFPYHTIADLQRDLKLPRPQHPLVSIAHYNGERAVQLELAPKVVLDFYKVSFIYGSHTRVNYGQRVYDFGKGGLSFVAPGRVMPTAACTDNDRISGQVLFFHPDFMRDQPLGKKLKNFGFPSYSVAEALYLSDDEREIVMNIYQQIGTELSRPVDQFSEELVSMQIDLLLTYSNRFYTQRFAATKNEPADLLTRFDELLLDYFTSNKTLEAGLPTVQYISEQLNYSSDYLSDMLRVATGQNTQQHIQNKIIERAKEDLSLSNLSVAEIAYQLGFEHPQSFNKMFKRKTNLSPLAYRQSIGKQ